MMLKVRQLLTSAILNVLLYAFICQAATVYLVPKESISIMHLLHGDTTLQHKNNRQTQQQKKKRKKIVINGTLYTNAETK